MNGRLGVESAVGRGTRFRVTLPLVPGIMPASVVQPERAIAAPAVAAGMRILVAEDHDLNQILMRALLERLGHRVDIAADGAAAVAGIAAAQQAGAPYALILMDMQMPVVDGLEATRLIRGRGIGPDVLPIVALTANAYPEDVAACRAAGMQAHLAKPIKMGDLTDALSRWLPVQKSTAAEDADAIELPPGLREAYAARRAQALDRLARMLREGWFGDDAVADVGTMLHQLAGTAGLFGDADLGDGACELDAGLAGWSADERASRMRSFLERHARAA